MRRVFSSLSFFLGCREIYKRGTASSLTFCRCCLGFPNAAMSGESPLPPFFFSMKEQRNSPAAVPLPSNSRIGPFFFPLRPPELRRSFSLFRIFMRAFSRQLWEAAPSLSFLSPLTEK